MLAVSGKAFSSKDWLFEMKIDGTRCIAKISDKAVELQNRRQRNITFRYPEITKALLQAGSDCILDGEMAVFSKGIPDFRSLEMRDQQVQSLRIDYLSKAMPANYIVFDILQKGQKNLMGLPLLERKSILKQELQENDYVTVIDYLQNDGEAHFRAALKKGLEGIMAKRLASPYQPGVRSSNWIKIKKKLTLDLVVGGYIPGQGARKSFFGGLLLGAYDSGKLRYLGRVGSGFTFRELEEISKEFKVSEESPFSRPPALQGVKWLKPELVLEVEAMEITKKGHSERPCISEGGPINLLKNARPISCN